MFKIYSTKRLTDKNKINTRKFAYLDFKKRFITIKLLS